MENFTWGALILIAGFALAIILGIVARVNSKATVRKKSGTAMIIFGIIGAIGLLSLFVQIPVLNDPVDFNIQPGAIGGGEETPQESPGSGEEIPLCAIEDTTVTVSTKDIYTSLATGGTHRYSVNGAPALTLSNAGSFTASPGDNIKFLLMNGSETDSNYNSKTFDVKVPCKGTYTVTQDLYQNGTVTLEVYNEEGDLINGGTNNETLANGDVVSLDIKVKGTYQTAWEYGGIIVAEYPKAQYDDVIIEFNGVATSATVPTFNTPLNGSQSRKAYEVPALFSTTAVLGKITLDVDDTINPTADGVNNVTLTYYPKGLYIDQKNGGNFAGPAVEDEDGVQTKKYSVLEGLTVN